MALGIKLVMQPLTIVELVLFSYILHQVPIAKQTTNKMRSIKYFFSDLYQNL